jgi:folate-dependent phosphoribosylglycinamide formyltransferase PurN
MYNALAPKVNIECVIVEDKPSRTKLVSNRIKKLGLARTTGQLFFIAFGKMIRSSSGNRHRQLISEYGLNETDFPDNITERVKSVNSQKTIALLEDLEPSAVVVNGTRIISHRVLQSIKAPFINAHMGITPRYRGVHGGYWALVNDDIENCGVTVHLVDRGIDTGGVLYQDTIRVDDSDNFYTYPIHQVSKAIPLMQSALKDIKEGRMQVNQGALPSKLWYHPTLFEYLWHRMTKGVK